MAPLEMDKNAGEGRFLLGIGWQPTRPKCDKRLGHRWVVPGIKNRSEHRQHLEGVKTSV